MENTVDQAMGVANVPQPISNNEIAATRTQSFGTNGVVQNNPVTPVAQPTAPVVENVAPVVQEEQVIQTQPIEPIQPETTLESVPSPESPEPIVPNEEEMRQQIADEGVVKKEEIKNELSKEVTNDEERQFIDKMVDELLTESEEQKFLLQRTTKQVGLYQAENDKLRAEISELKSDTSKVPVENEIVPIVNVLKKFLSNKDDKDTQFQAVQSLINFASSITGEDYSGQISNFFSKQANLISGMSGSTGTTTGNQEAIKYTQQETPRTRVRGVTKSATSTKRF